MSHLLSLPDEVLKLVLTHVPLKDRLGNCSLVHTRMHAAAVAVTQQFRVDMRLTRLQPQRTQSVLDWLSRHGQHVDCLEVYHLCQPLTQLALPNLLELCFQGGRIQLGPTADGCPGVIAGVTQLTRLELDWVDVVDGPVVDSLSRLVHLQYLNLRSQTGNRDVTLSDATLPQLRRLRHLHACLSLNNMLQLSALTALQELSLEPDFGINVSPSSVTSLVLPPSLTWLRLSARTDQQMLSALLSLAPTQLRALEITWWAFDGSQLPLSSVSRLQCLTQLEVRAWPSDLAPGAPAIATVWPPPGPAYSALTASSSLVSLMVNGVLPAGVWPFVFPAGRQLPDLTSLAFDREWDDPVVPWALGAADLAALVSCCPGLRGIYTMCLLPGPHVSALCKLTALSSLEAYCTASDMADTIQGLAAVTQLESLRVDVCRPTAPLPVASLLPLTSLTALTRLCCMCSKWRGDEKTLADLNTLAGSPPDVSLQLLERCTAADAR